MKTSILKTCFFLFLIAMPIQLLFGQGSIPRGIFLFGQTSVDFGQIKNDLHLNYIQGSAGYVGLDLPEILTNSGGLKVLALRELLSHYASAQRMEFEAEDAPPGEENAWNYFQEKLTGRTDGTARRCDPTEQHSAGYMVKSAVPDDQYHYKRNSYTAKFVMRVEKDKTGDPDIATVSVYCKTHDHVKASLLIGYVDFPDQNPVTIPLTFDLDTQSGNPPYVFPKAVLMGIPDSPLREDPYQNCKEIDFRVYWHGIVTTWLDKVIVEDDVAKNLFAGVHSDTIASEANTFKSSASYPLVQRFYLTDEPLPSAFLAYNYVDEGLKAVQPDGLAGGRGRGITANYWHNSWAKRFIGDGQPSEYLFDQYEMTVNIPSPSINAQDAQALGIQEYTTDQSYTDAVQAAFNNLIGKFGSLRQNISPTPFWYVPQLHGEYNVSQRKYIRARPPTGNEIKATMHLALAHGAKGIIAYPFGTDYWEGWYYPGLVSNVASQDGKYRDHSGQTAVLDGQTVFTGYQDKWDGFAQAMYKLGLIESVLSQLTWQGAKNWHQEMTKGTWENLITNIMTKNLSDVQDNVSCVETVHFRLSGTDYVFVVNRRTLQSDNRWIYVYLATPPSNKQWRMTEMATGAVEGTLPPVPVS